MRNVLMHEDDCVIMSVENIHLFFSSILGPLASGATRSFLSVTRNIFKLLHLTATTATLLSAGIDSPWECLHDIRLRVDVRGKNPFFLIKLVLRSTA